MTLAEVNARCVIVGGGIQGLATAYELARLGMKDIVVLERSYLNAGASGRNGGGVRAQWSSRDNIELMRESIQICRAFASEHRINVWFRQGGYLFVARSPERAAELETSSALQRECGLDTHVLSPVRAKAIVPELDATRILAASFNASDGVVFPWPFLWGYARHAKELGVDVRTHTEVTAIETENGRVSAVVTEDTRFRAPLVLCAAGAWSPEVARLVGVELPNHPHRHEICSTEPLKPFLGPLVADLGSGLYFSQSMRGEIVGGISNREVPPGLDQNSSLKFLGLYAKALTEMMPILGHVRVLRQWAGCYDLTPDGAPIFGRVDGVDGFLVTCGFMGHGFMIAPVVAKILARHLAKDEDHPLLTKWNLRRFKEGKLLRETMILG